MEMQLITLYVNQFSYLRIIHPPVIQNGKLIVRLFSFKSKSMFAHSRLSSGETRSSLHNAYYKKESRACDERIFDTSGCDYVCVRFA
jgi:hypothetical protein